MTLFEILKGFCGRTGLTQPVSVFGSQDDQIIQLAELANEGLDDMTTRHVWQVLQRECLHTTLAAEDQGAITTIASTGFLYIIDNKIYNRTLNTELVGPASASDWQHMKAGVGVGTGSWRLRGGHLLILPNPTVGQTLAFEYASSAAVLAADGTTYKSYFSADNDQFLLPANFLTMWLRWRWKKEKGFSYDEDFRLYETLLTNAASKDGEGKIIDMSGSAVQGPGIFIPAGMYVPGT